MIIVSDWEASLVAGWCNLFVYSLSIRSVGCGSNLYCMHGDLEWKWYRWSSYTISNVERINASIRRYSPVALDRTDIRLPYSGVILWSIVDFSNLLPTINEYDETNTTLMWLFFFQIVYIKHNLTFYVNLFGLSSSVNVSPQVQRASFLEWLMDNVDMWDCILI